jgi:hypothetical protein
MDTDFIDKNELERLLEERDENCISIYLPMVRVGTDVQGNSIQLKNALNEVEKELKQRGRRQPDIDDLLAQPRQLLSDSPFWQHQLDGLAMFISPETLATYRLPLDFEPLTIVAERFHIKPILPLISGDGRFYILALSQDQVRLFQGTRHTVDEMEIRHAPGSLADALVYDDPERQMQHHTTTSGSAGGPAVVRHGQGVQEDEKRQRLRRYFQDVSKGIQRQLYDEEAPIVLAALDYLHPIYKEVDTSPHLLDEGITVNPNELSAAELHDRAWTIVGPLFTEAKEEAVDRYKQLSGSKQASAELEEIVPAAFQGRIDTLFVATGTHRWGSYDPDNDSLRLHEEPQNGDRPGSD